MSCVFYGGITVGCAGSAQTLRSVWIPPKKGRVTGVESLLVSFDDLIFTVGWGKQSFGRMLRASGEPRCPVPRCSSGVWRQPKKSLPGAAGDAGEGALDSVGLAGAPVAEGDPEPREGAEEGLVWQDMHRMAHAAFVPRGLHPSAAGKWAQALSGCPWTGWIRQLLLGCAEPLGQLQSPFLVQLHWFWLGAAAAVPVCPGRGSEHPAGHESITKAAID